MQTILNGNATRLALPAAPWRGWQSQTGGITVQDCLQDAFSRILQTPQKISAAGRTDAGVHALGQCFHADVRTAAG